uniref:Laminin G domain-containing protein n=1 Tax=Glossina brevipalpis TaxID=37001 RepID=A0A1A9WJG0_9MUSC
MYHKQQKQLQLPSSSLSMILQRKRCNRQIHESGTLYALVTLVGLLLGSYAILQASEATPIVSSKTSGHNKQEQKQEQQQQQQQQQKQENNVLCPHVSLAKLIKTSPVILKALGAHVFTNDDDDDFRVLQNSNDALLLKWQNEQNKILMSSTAAIASPPAQTLLSNTQRFSKTKTSSIWFTNSQSSRENREQTMQTKAQTQAQTFSDAASSRAAMLASFNADAILITLTPETVYKGASLLKTAPGAEQAQRSIQSNSGLGTESPYNTSNGDGGGGNNTGSINSSESSYLYEGQLNATVQPLSCFDQNLLKLLPSELIVFGKLVTIRQQQQHGLDDLMPPQPQYGSTIRESEQQQSHQRMQSPSLGSLFSSLQSTSEDVLKISINGLHRWSSQFENYIWKHLGWDDWSDFTVCSVACGKGVQQRFRRCLLDNPMVDLNMQHYNAINMNANKEDANDSLVFENDAAFSEQQQITENDDISLDDDEKNSRSEVIVNSGNLMRELVNNVVMSKTEITAERLQQQFTEFSGFTTMSPVAVTDDILRHDHHVVNADMLSTNNKLKALKLASGLDTTSSLPHITEPAKTKSRLSDFKLQQRNHVEDQEVEKEQTDGELEIMRIFEGHLNSESQEELQLLPTPDTDMLSSTSGTTTNRKNSRKRKRHKTTKTFSTMSCEGYNIEQRNCNTFECNDDINDLMKFYTKKYSNGDDTNGASSVASDINTNPTDTVQIPANSNDEITGSWLPTGRISFERNIASEMGGASSASSSAPSSSTSVGGTAATTPSNIGYVFSWYNTLNFTIMLTLRVKNESKLGSNGGSSSNSCGSGTIFSIRNVTHNLYLESCKDGLRLYLERDKTTEMLPIKFKLCDYHWHQISISVQNGDFISIYVDCSWTNSFVVSKRLFSLPINADVEIGRAFYGELQQLLILPDNQERQQCSNKRTSINEVKRYIIDTFIDDYGN